MEKLYLGSHEHIALCDALKVMGWADNGGHSKGLIAEGLVAVDGCVETRKRCKIIAGQVINFMGQKAVVMPGEEAP